MSLAAALIFLIIAKGSDKNEWYLGLYAIALIMALVAEICRMAMEKKPSKVLKWVIYVATFLGIAMAIIAFALVAGSMAPA